MSFEIDVSGFDELAAKLSRVRVVDVATPIVARAGQEMKRSIRADTSGFTHPGSLKNTVFYRLKKSGNTVEATVGPERGGAGSMAFLWLGNAKSAPIFPHPDRYAKREAEQTVRHLEAALRRALR